MTLHNLRPRASTRRRPFRTSVATATRGAFSLVELAVVLAICAVLAALLVPTIKTALDYSRSTRCLSNLRQIGALISTYVADNDGYLPYNDKSASIRWYMLLNTYGGYDISSKAGDSSSPFLCPANRYYPNDRYTLWVDYGYLCNWLLMQRIDGGGTRVRLASVTKRRIMVSDTIKGKEKLQFVHLNNEKEENTERPFPNYEQNAPELWIHKFGINALWTDFSASYHPIDEINRPGSEIPGGAYYGRGN